MKEGQVKVTAIIPSLYEVDGPYVKLCVESLRASGVDWNIIVVTNGSQQKPVVDDIEGLSQHLWRQQQGQCGAVNAGASVATPDTDYLFIINSDMYFAPDWHRNLRFDYDVFSPNLSEPVNNAGSAPPFIKVDGGLTIEDFDKAKVDEHVQSIVESGPAVPQPGFNLPFFIKKEVWNTIGGYDEAYDPWGSNSDTDLQTKIALAGITPMRYNDVNVYHFSNKSGTFDGSHQEAWQKNWDYFQNKWGFNRDQLGSDVWLHKNILPEDRQIIKYQPAWMHKYGP